MALTFCLTCNRKQYHLLKGVCSGHSDLGAKPKVDHSKFSIPPYVAEVKPPYQPPVTKKIKVTTGLLFKDSTKIDALLGIETPKVKPSVGFHCSFCGVEVNYRNMTRGITKPRKVLSTEELLHPITKEVIGYTEKIFHIPGKVIACPDCSTQIVPIYNRCRFCKGKDDIEIAQCIHCKGTKQGEMQSQGTIFPEFD